MGIKNLWTKIKNTLFKRYRNFYEFFWICDFPDNPYLKASKCVETNQVTKGMTIKELRDLAGKPTKTENHENGIKILKYMQGYQGYIEWWAFTFNNENKLIFYEYENNQLIPVEWDKTKKSK